MPKSALPLLVVLVFATSCTVDEPGELAELDEQATPLETTATPLGAPTSLVARGTAAAWTQLTWVDNATAETGFAIDCTVYPDSTLAPWREVYRVERNMTTFTDTNRCGLGGFTLLPETSLQYRVRALDATTTSASSNVAIAIPAPPASLGAIAITHNRIDLAWVDASWNDTEMAIERSQYSLGPYVVVGRAPAGATAYSDTTVYGSSLYYYRVRARHSVAGYSLPSNSAFAQTQMPPPAAPTNLIVTKTGWQQFYAQWTDSSTNEQSFTVQCRMVGSLTTPWQTIATVAANTTSVAASCPTLLPGSFGFRVGAANSSGTTWSSETVVAL